MKILPHTTAGWLRVLVPLALVGLAAAGWLLWRPGAKITDGRHDLGHNGIFMNHAWLADDTWFASSPDRLRLMTQCRDTEHVITKLNDLHIQGIRDLFVDLLPCAPDGSLPRPGWSATEVLALQAAARGQRAMPWVGGTRGVECFPDKPEWRRNFSTACAELCGKSPHLAGVLVNIEPWEEGDEACLALLRDLRQALPKGKEIAVVACPPPVTPWRNPRTHWGRAYFGQVAAACDLMVVRLYDTGISSGKLYAHFVATASRDALNFSGKTPVLLNIADYAEAVPQPWHDPATENLERGLRGVHGALGKALPLPANYAGVALFSEEAMTEDKWVVWRREFRRPEIRKEIRKETPKIAPAIPGPWKPAKK